MLNCNDVSQHYYYVYFSGATSTQERNKTDSRMCSAVCLVCSCVKLDLVMYYNILHGFVDIDAVSLFDTINCNVIRSRGHPLGIIKQHCNVNCRSSSFVCRNVNAWNSLPEHVVNCKTTATFKPRLSTVDLTQFVNF